MKWRGERSIEGRAREDVPVRVNRGRAVKRKGASGGERVRGGIIKYFLCV